VKKCFQLPFIAALAMFFASISWGSLAAQQTTPDTQQPTTQTQQPPDTQAPPPSQSSQPAQTQQGQTTPSQPSSAPPDTSATPDPSASATGAKEFVGTVMKQGDKYVFQDSATGTTYDIDRQDEVKKFEGKKVRVHGTLDSSGKMIHVQ
jgi:hypothetical protein